MDWKARFELEAEIAESCYRGSKIWQERYEQANRDLISARAETDAWKRNRDESVAILEREIADLRRRQRPTLLERMNEPFEPVDIEQAREWYREAREWAEKNARELPAWLERIPETPA